VGEARGQFGNPEGKGTSDVRSLYQRTGEERPGREIQCALQWTVDCVNPWTIKLNCHYKCKRPINPVTNPNPTSIITLHPICNNMLDINYAAWVSELRNGEQHERIITSLEAILVRVGVVLLNCKSLSHKLTGRNKVYYCRNYFKQRLNYVSVNKFIQDSVSLCVHNLNIGTEL
jgi:hypothetical protein